MEGAMLNVWFLAQVGANTAERVAARELNADDVVSTFGQEATSINSGVPR
jgi:hypothetical protein